MAVTGEFSRLGQLRQRLETLGRAEGLRPIIGELTSEAMRLVVEGFVEERDPYGNKWDPRKQPTGTWNLLDKSGQGIDQLRARGTSTSIRFTTLAYMKYHLSGTHRMVARPWLPTQSGTLGPIWGEAFNRIAAKRIRERLGIR